MDLYRSVFGLEWKDLSKEEKSIVADDIDTLADDQFDCDVLDAAIELRRRIGGPVNLHSYARTLCAGRRVR